MSSEGTKPAIVTPRVVDPNGLQITRLTKRGPGGTYGAIVDYRDGRTPGPDVIAFLDGPTIHRLYRQLGELMST